MTQGSKTYCFSAYTHYFVGFGVAGNALIIPLLGFLERDVLIISARKP